MSGTSSHWRLKARSIIQSVIENHPKPTNGDELQKLFRAMSKAYPWGERAMHPYKMWGIEIRIAKTRLQRDLFGSNCHAPFTVRCPTCNAGIGMPCKAFGSIEFHFEVARDAELEGRHESALEVLAQAFHEARLLLVGLGTERETLPLGFA